MSTVGLLTICVHPCYDAPDESRAAYLAAAAEPDSWPIWSVSGQSVALAPSEAEMAGNRHMRPTHILRGPFHDT